MKNYFKQLLAKDLEKILSIKQAEIYKFLEYPKDETMADLALPCFASAKANGVKPQDCANAVVEVFKSKNFTASAVGGFVNFKINPAAFDTFLQSVLDDKNLTIQKEKKKTIIMDAGGANVAKELHMGHLRSPIIGEALKRLYRVFGHKVISDVHLGDWGLQMGLTILQIEIEKKSLKNIKEEEITLDFLNEVYPKASAKAKVDEAFRKKAEDYTVRIQKKQEPYYEAYRIIHRASLKDIRKNYDNLFVEFELWLGESDAEAYTDYIIDYLIKKGVTKEENGTLIVEVKKEGEHILKPKTNPTDKDEYLNPMPPLILKKANEGVLYATTDLATIYQRIKDYKPDEMIYVVDERQRMHFEQVFRTADKAGLFPRDKMLHVGFGTINGTDGKPFKTRGGNTVKLNLVVEEAIEKAEARLKENDVGVALERDPQAMRELAHKIAISAIKFGDLSNTVKKDYVLDFDKFLSFEGKTGPYLLYTVARINSILEKAVGVAPKSDPKFQIEIATHEVAMQVVKLIDSFYLSLKENTLSHICQQAFNLAKAFSGFYAATNILKEKDEKKKQGYIQLCRLTKKCLEFTLDTLAMPTVQKM